MMVKPRIVDLEDVARLTPKLCFNERTLYSGSHLEIRDFNPSVRQPAVKGPRHAPNCILQKLQLHWKFRAIESDDAYRNILQSQYMI